MPLNSNRSQIRHLTLHRQIYPCEPREGISNAHGLRPPKMYLHSEMSHDKLYSCYQIPGLLVRIVTAGIVSFWFSNRRDLFERWFKIEIYDIWRAWSCSLGAKGTHVFFPRRRMKQWNMHGWACRYLGVMWDLRRRPPYSPPMCLLTSAWATLWMVDRLLKGLAVWTVGLFFFAS